MKKIFAVLIAVFLIAFPIMTSARDAESTKKYKETHTDISFENIDIIWSNESKNLDFFVTKVPGILINGKLKSMSTI